MSLPAIVLGVWFHINFYRVIWGANFVLVLNFGGKDLGRRESDISIMESIPFNSVWQSLATSGSLIVGNVF